MAKSRFGPAASTALLLEAPQCVPYAQRVEVFRSFIARWKSMCASDQRVRTPILPALPQFPAQTRRTQSGSSCLAVE